MDHLPYPATSPHPRLKVPLCVSEDEVAECNSFGLECSPFQHKWASKPVSLRWLESPSVESKAQIVQKWLYFGLLSKFLGRRVNFQDFSGDAYYLDSSCLPRYLQGSRLQIADVIAYEAILQNVDYHLDCFDEHLNNQQENRGVDTAQKVAFSVRILIDSLRRALRNRPEFAKAEESRDHFSYRNPYRSPGMTCTLLSKRMERRNGWCSMLVTDILSNFSSSAAYYLSSLPRENGLLEDHSMCTKFECKLTVNYATYEPKHVHAGCDCQMPRAPLEQVTKVIDEGGIPLVSLGGDSISVERSALKVPYAAISHVWAGGLGNRQANTLPICQLRRLASLPGTAHERLLQHLAPESRGAEDFFPRVFESILGPASLVRKRVSNRYWMDTLCLPVNPANENQIRKTKDAAINRMSQTYAGSHSTIVLDTELAEIAFVSQDNLSQDSLLFYYGRILCSAWISRCWTYEEAAMAPLLFIKMRSGLFAMTWERAKTIGLSAFLHAPPSVLILLGLMPLGFTPRVFIGFAHPPYS